METCKGIQIPHRDVEPGPGKGHPAWHQRSETDDADFMEGKARVLELLKGLNDPGGQIGCMAAIRRSRERAD